MEGKCRVQETFAELTRSELSQSYWQQPLSFVLEALVRSFCGALALDSAAYGRAVASSAGPEGLQQRGKSMSDMLHHLWMCCDYRGLLVLPE